ncbi:DUF4145 domain-containing protein [Aliarcobacter butzleri]
MKFLKRIEELIKEGDIVKNTLYEKDAGFSMAKYVDLFKYTQWKLKVQNIIELTAGKNSTYLKKFSEIESVKYIAGQTYPHFIGQFALLNALKDDYENGFLVSLKSLVEADVFETELEQAKELLSNKYKLAAAVIAGVVLETALRSLCDKEKIPHGKLTKMNDDLTKAGVYNKFQQKNITALADIRNSAAHGKDSEFTHENVENMIRDIESFLATYLN